MENQDERRDVRAVVRTYKKDGKDVNAYETIGTAWVSPHASTISIQLDTLPISKDWNGKLYINKPYGPKEDKSANELTHEFNKMVTSDNLPSDEEGDKPIDLSEIPF